MYSEGQTRQKLVKELISSISLNVNEKSEADKQWREYTLI